MSDASSGGVSANTSLIARIICLSSLSIALTISLVEMFAERGRPWMKSRPFMTTVSSSSRAIAAPILILTNREIVCFLYIVSDSLINFVSSTID